LIITKKGETFAIVGNYDAETARLTGAYQNVIPYQNSLRRSLLHTLERVYPAKIAVNYSKNDVQADGLSYGMYQLLVDYFNATPWEQRLVSAESVIGALRGRKTPAEIARVRAAVETTRKIFERTFEHIHLGMTEIQVHQYMVNMMEEFEVEAAWELHNCPIVNIGPESKVGHVGPTSIALQPGQLVHIDFGVRQDEYCSDIQRMAYFLAPDEKQAPEPIQRGFDTLVKAIQAAVSAMTPGVPGNRRDRAQGDHRGRLSRIQTRHRASIGTAGSRRRRSFRTGMGTLRRDAQLPHRSGSNLHGRTQPGITRLWTDRPGRRCVGNR
jgi:Xaa-Pro aminopeptidase